MSRERPFQILVSLNSYFFAPTYRRPNRTVSIKISDQGNYLDYGALVNPFHCSHCHYPHLSIPSRVNFYDTSKRPFVGAIGSARTHTTSPTRRLRDGTGHLDSFRWLVIYSADRHCQKCRTSAWHKRQRHNTDIEVAHDSVSGKASRGAPTRKCPGVRASFRPPDVGAASEVLNSGMPLSVPER